MRIVWDSFSLQFISDCKFIGQVLKVYRNTNIRRSLSCLLLAHPPKCPGLLKIYTMQPDSMLDSWRFQERPSAGFDEYFVISKEITITPTNMHKQLSTALYLHSY